MAAHPARPDNPYTKVPLEEDIVQRLRRASKMISPPVMWCSEAADEIMRLRSLFDSKFALGLSWKTAATAPRDGTHILVCEGPYGSLTTFDQRPPVICHYFPDPDEPGFYQSSGIVQDSYNDHPIQFTHWRPLGDPPSAIDS